MHGWIGFFRNPGIVGKVKIAESWARYVRRLAMYPSYLSWNELVFWHDVVKNTKDATECGLEKDPKSGSYARINKREDDCLEALARTKRYAKST